MKVTGAASTRGLFIRIFIVKILSLSARPSFYVCRIIERSSAPYNTEFRTHLIFLAMYAELYEILCVQNYRKD